MTVLECVSQKVSEWIASLECASVDRLVDKLHSGKMLRSKLILNIAGESEDSLTLCAIVEMIQTASLLHDDVIDNSATRRGKASMNAEFGNKNAIMLGDIFYSKAFLELMHFMDKFPLIPKIIANAVVLLSRGEILDVSLSQSFNADRDKYLAMIGDKTASLIEACAVSAAILAHKDVEAFRVYGHNLGLAFQIIDDVLDITSSSRVLGKPTMSDFSEGKTTLPYIYLYESLEDARKQYLKSLFGITLSREKQEWIRSNMEKYHTISRSIEFAQNLGNEAIKAIANQSCDKLIEIMEDMIKREF